MQSTKAILEQIERACEAAGLVKSETHQTPSTRRRVDWFIRHDILEEPTSSILETKHGKRHICSETKFYKALQEIRQRLIPKQGAQAGSPSEGDQVMATKILTFSSEEELEATLQQLDAAHGDPSALPNSH